MMKRRTKGGNEREKERKRLKGSNGTEEWRESEKKR
jgi:hypothetical protein